MTQKVKKVKKVIKQKFISNPNTKFYFLVGAGIGFAIAGMTLPPVGAIDLLTSKKWSLTW